MDPHPDSSGLPAETDKIFEVQEDPISNSDEELADIMADPDVAEADDFVADSSSAAVEGIIPPAVEDKDGVESEEEPFSMDDFEESFTAEKDNGQEPSESEEIEVAHSYDLPEESAAPAPAEEGEVADFRRSLANLAAQAELDRIAFLRDGLARQGDPVPTLEEIAADVKGDKLLHPEGDCDLYGRRPNARLEGWQVGLAFGVPRRAKRFSKT
ncbi:MAG: hypothetical protein CMI26_14065 [Opitutae bacterium]|nr:hypothetical protein [Opitutae bacterium]|tara:strand:+ start:4828 stop:5466 length:639 start_codon:yes stop_codon:yes gene_type:complete